jgi:hypothetical protein
MPAVGPVLSGLTPLASLAQVFLANELPPSTLSSLVYFGSFYRQFLVID